jgi:hypothetical protein
MQGDTKYNIFENRVSYLATGFCQNQDECFWSLDAGVEWGYALYTIYLIS